MADTSKIGFKSHLTFCATSPVIVENRAFTQYLPAAKSASNIPTIAVTRPRISEDGRFLGGALAAFHLAEFQRWIQSFPLGEHDVLAVSVGVTTYCRGDTTFAGMLGRADKALYAAKNAGRNQVFVVWPESRVENVA